MIITISGKPGSGKSTVAKLVANKLGFRHYSVGDLMGEMARKKGMKLEQLGEIAKKESWVDNELDEYQKKLGETEDNVVIDSRIGFYFIPHSVKILLDVDLKEGSKRIFNDQRSDEESRKTAEDMLKAVKKRMELEKERYKKYYNIDYQDSGNFDYVIDTTHITAEQVSEKIVRFIKTRIAEGVKNVLKNNH